ncbi:MAG: VacJ family lipoprotein [Sulfuricaulis sp.]|uniref:VacJ family lipoprotein n=1 Tax=Sulfuricaulis sp. TaxID=2003553 RepID=UPI0034A3FE31
MPIPVLLQRLLSGGLCLLLLNACGTVPPRSVDSDAATAVGEAKVTAEGNSTAEARNKPGDPLEGFNRAMYTFNDKMDRYILKPVAKGYRAVTPKPVRRGISNFFSNLREPIVMLNNLLQGKPADAVSDLSRFVFNSTFGIFGLFDVASKMDLPKHNEDFGQTLAVWGVSDGAYLVLPFFGPSNLRDGPALVVDWETYPPNHMEERSTRAKLLLVETVDKRAQLLDASDILDQAAGQDPYVFVRETFRQLRRNQVYDGNPPQAAPPAFLFEDDNPAPAAPKQRPENAPASSP